MSSGSEASPRISLKNKERILRSVDHNRVTIIVGSTGSGKSTLIPPLILDELPICRTKPVLCSQPRRLAVVAIAKRVAETRRLQREQQRGGDPPETGRQDRRYQHEEVGYHVGNQNFSTNQTRLCFTTAGILLEQLRANGISTLSKFGVIIIDECHERSPESDLVMALIKHFMLTNPKEDSVRIILMSATFDSHRYQRFFQHVPGCSTIDIIPLETAQSFCAYYNQVQELYLEDIVKELPQSEIVTSLMRPFLKDPNEDLRYNHGKELSPNLLFLIHQLVSWLHETEESKDAPFLIFAPTYRHLEQLHTSLERITTLKLHVLHSSVDMENCLCSMMPRSDTSLLNGTTVGVAEVNGHASRGRNRRVLLASAIAESSVTVPGVTCVIDMCRSLEVRWHNDSKNYTPKTVWSSRSICGQRRGRTGRTCAGRVFRLLPRQFYHRELGEWDVPQLTISSCHNEVLALITAKTKSINARALLLHSAGRDGGSCCLDPPDAEVVEDAVEHLKVLGACEEEEAEQSSFLSSSRRKKNNNTLPPPLVPTTYGLLLAALPLAVRDASVVLAGAQVGLLYETMALRAICNHKPNPIVQYFGKRERNNYTLLSYYPDYDESDPISAHLANLAAYMYWDAEWNSMRAVQAEASFVEKCNREHLLQQQQQDASHVASWNVWKWTEELEEEHIIWCHEHEINPTAVRSISEVLENTIHVFYRAQFEPEWLNCNNPTPIWKRRSDWRGRASYGDRGMFQRVYSRPELVCDALVALCNNKTSVATTIAHKLLGVPMAPSSRGTSTACQPAELACVHHLEGFCRFGNKCRSSHSPNAKRPPCRFYQQGTCTKGHACIYSHDSSDAEQVEEERTPLGTAKKAASRLKALVPLLPHSSLAPQQGGGVLGWFRQHHNNMIMLGEAKFQFTLALEGLGLGPLASSTNAGVPSELRSRGYWEGIDATRLHTDARVIRALLRQLRSFCWNFPYITTNDDKIMVEEDHADHELLILETFMSLSLLHEIACACVAAFGPPMPPFTLALTLQGDQFSRWSVLRSAWRSGWNLVGWLPFDSSLFPGYTPSRHSGSTFQADRSRFYVFSSY